MFKGQTNRGVNFGRRLPPIGGHSSTPINTLDKFPTLIKSSDVKGKWHDFVINVLWTTEDHGRIEILVNGNGKMLANGPTLRNKLEKGVRKIVRQYTGSCQSKTAYTKYGIYRGHVSFNPKSKTAKTVPYFDGLRRNRTGDGMFEELDE